MSSDSSGPASISDTAGPQVPYRPDLPSAEDDRELNRLLTTVNESSGAARTAWMFFLGLMAYFLVSIASVSHQDLLLNRPVHLPFLDIDIELDKFFRFSPLVLLIIHFGVYLQHVLLSRKAVRVHQLLKTHEDALGLAPRCHPMRLRVHSYFFTQIYAGSRRSYTFKQFLLGMNVLSFVLLPILLFLAFQTSFLAYHDEAMTNWHRIYLLIDIVLIFLMQQFMREAQDAPSLIASVLSQCVRMIKYAPSMIVIAASWLVATIPGEPADKMMTRLAGVPVPFEYQFGFSGSCHRALGAGWRPYCNAVFGAPQVKLDQERPVRHAFVLTAFLFEGEVDYGRGESKSWFSRNLIVPDRDLSVARTEFQRRDGASGISGNGENLVTTERVKLSLRGRDLRYAVFDRSNFTGADFTLADLEGTSFLGANLADATISCAVKPLRSETGGEFKECAKLFAAQFDGAIMHRADLRGACAVGTSMKSADMRGSTFFKAALVGADLTLARLDGAVLAEARLQGAKLLGTELRGASLRFATLQPLDAKLIDDDDDMVPYDDCIDEMPGWVKERLRALISENDGRTNAAQANLELADLRLANLQSADLTRARLSGADLHLTQMQGIELSKADLRNADLSYASLQGSDLSNAQLDGAMLIDTKLNGAVLQTARLWGADLKRASFHGADLRFASLEGAKLEGTKFQAADVRCAHIPDTFASESTGVQGLLDLADFHGAVRMAISPSDRTRIEREAKSNEAKRLALRRLKFDSPRQRLLGEAEDRWDQNGAGTGAERQADVSGDANSRRDRCQTGTSLSETDAERLGTALAAIICADEPNIGFMARGIARRIIASDAKDVPKFQAAPGVLLAALKTNPAARQGGVDSGGAKSTVPACITRIAGRDLFGLSLLAARAQQK